VKRQKPFKEITKRGAVFVRHGTNMIFTKIDGQTPLPKSHAMPILMNWSQRKSSSFSPTKRD